MKTLNRVFTPNPVFKGASFWASCEKKFHFNMLEKYWAREDFPENESKSGREKMEERNLRPSINGKNNIFILARPLQNEGTDVSPPLISGNLPTS